MGSPLVCGCSLYSLKVQSVLCWHKQWILTQDPRSFMGTGVPPCLEKHAFYPGNIRKTSHCWDSCHPSSQPCPSFHHLVLHFQPSSCLCLSNTTPCMIPSPLPPLIPLPVNTARFIFKSSIQGAPSVLPRISATTYNTFYCSKPTTSGTPASLKTGSGSHTHLCHH